MFKVLLIVFSVLATAMSVIFMLSTDLFRKIEEILGLEFGGGLAIATVLEGKVDFVNDWVYRNHVFFGPLFAILAALNTRNAWFF